MTSGFVNVPNRVLPYLVYGTVRNMDLYIYLYNPSNALINQTIPTRDSHTSTSKQQQTNVALPTGWSNNGGRCLHNITINGNERGVVAMVVDECDSTKGYLTSIMTTDHRMLTTLLTPQRLFGKHWALLRNNRVAYISHGPRLRCLVTFCICLPWFICSNLFLLFCLMHVVHMFLFFNLFLSVFLDRQSITNVGKKWFHLFSVGGQNFRKHMKR